MSKECKGIIIEIFEQADGYILGEDGNQYIFSKADFLADFELQLQMPVYFKPLKIETRKEPLYRAILIDKN